MSSSINPLQLTDLEAYWERCRLDARTPSLTVEQLQEAVIKHTQALDFPEIERSYIDPPISGQVLSNFMFIPAKDAKPNEEGVYGIIKIRGSFPSREEAFAHADDIVQNVDSMNDTLTVRTGMPVPLLAPEVRKGLKHPRVKIQPNQVVRAETKEAIRQKLLDEKRRIEEIKAREKELLEDVKREEEPEDDRYTTLRTSRAQQAMVFLKNIKLCVQMRENIDRCTREIEALDVKDPSLQDTFLDKYDLARKNAGIDSATQDARDFTDAIKQVPEEVFAYKLLHGDEQLF